MINTKAVIDKMSVVLSNEQLAILEMVLNQEDKEIGSNTELIEAFVNSKKYENCSQKTIKQYKREIELFCDWFKESVVNVTKRDIENYVCYYKQNHEISDTTANNIRRFISAFFAYLENEDIIRNNPVKKTKPIKTCKQVKRAYTEVEVENMRNGAKNFRDKVIIDTLNSTGMRISELTNLNRDDVYNGAAIVKGKGNKEREVYFSEVAWDELMKYLESRKDDNPSLFISNRNTRMTKDRTEQIIRNIGKASNVKAHPHKFRRTFASRMINNGCPIQEVQQLLGHKSIETTMIYCDINKDNIKYDHKKYC